ncbi:MAG: vWA domain-containing protein [Trueperaceae bacterium]
MTRLSLALSMVLLFTLGQAQTYVQLVLDASGSMWNKLDDGTYRITAAKDVLGNFIKGLPGGDLNVGLRVYGANISAMDEGACDDIQLVVPMSGVDKPGLQTAVDATQATGATPIAKALELAAADFPTEATKKLIVLVTDGEESCGGDLAGVAEQLKAQGIEIELKVIGFALDEAAQQSFEGVAEFVNAADAEQLATALDTAVEEVVAEVNVPAEPERQDITLNVPTPAPAGQPLEISYDSTDLRPSDYVTIVPASAGDEVEGDYSYVDVETKTSILNTPFEAGNYEVRYIANDVVLARESVTLEASDITMRPLSEIRAGANFQIEWTGPKGEEDFIVVVPEGTADDAELSSNNYDYAYTSSGSPLELEASLEPGTYELRYMTERNEEEGQVFARTPVEILEAVPVFLEAPKEIPGGSTFEVEWAGPSNESDQIILVPVSTDANESEGIDAYYTENAENPINLTAPLDVGDYELRYIGRGSGDEQKVLGTFPVKVIAVAATVEAPSEIVGGSSFAVTWSGSTGEYDVVSIVPAGAAEDEDGSDYRYVGGETPPLQLTAPVDAGDYEVRLVNSSEDKVLATFPVKIVASNATVTVPSEMMAGSLVEVSWSGSTGESDVITIVPLSTAEDEYDVCSGGYTYVYDEQSPLQLQTPFKAGDYEARLVNVNEGKVLARAPITLMEPEITLQAPSEVTAGSELQVRFTGPNTDSFIVAIVPAGIPTTDESGSDQTFDDDGGAYTYGEGSNGAVTLYAPEQPGEYEVRYLVYGNDTIFANVPITVK